MVLSAWDTVNNESEAMIIERTVFSAPQLLVGFRTAMPIGNSKLAYAKAGQENKKT